MVMRKERKGSFCPPLGALGLVLAISFSVAARQAPAKEDAGPRAHAGVLVLAQSTQQPQREEKSGDPASADGVSPAPEAVAQSQQNPQSAQNPPAPSQGPANGAQESGQKPEEKPEPSKQQPKRILGVMPNFRAVTAGTIAPPPTPKQSFILATQNSFDYSSFIFVGFTSAFAEWTNAHKQLGQGMPGYGRYYWRGLVDKTDGNYLVLFALPTVFHQDERYYARGKGGFWRRFGYASTRVFITPDYKGHDSFNASELLGRGIAQGISVLYYPSKSRTVGAISAKYGYAIMRDALTSVFREFWPDIATHVLHRHP